MTHFCAPPLFFRNAQYNDDHYPDSIKTQFVFGSTRDTIWEKILDTWYSPDFRQYQEDGRRRVYKDFADPVGEFFYFDKEGNLLSILIYTLKLVYDRDWNGNVVFITAYPKLWRIRGTNNLSPIIKKTFLHIIIMWMVLIVTMLTLHVLYFCSLCLHKLAFLLLPCFAAVGRIIGCFHDFRYYLCHLLSLSLLL